jgi:MtfA peptidase
MSIAAAAIVGFALAVIAWLLLQPVLQSRRRRQAVAAPFSGERRAIIASNVPVYRRLPPGLRSRLDGLINAFVAEKSFVGCNGLEVTEEMRVTIAAYACLLVLGRPGSFYESLRSILVYPAPFWVAEEDEDDTGLVTERRHVLSGQAFDVSRIILSWEDVLQTADTPGAGYNLVLHEFAHYLDAEGLGLAAPTPGRPLAEWSRELGDEFDRLLAAIDRGEVAFLDPYAAEDEAEFFAVATEEFLERPSELRAAHPRLYGLLHEFYGLDPAGWLG